MVLLQLQATYVVVRRCLVTNSATLRRQEAESDLVQRQTVTQATVQRRLELQFQSGHSQQVKQLALNWLLTTTHLNLRPLVMGLVASLLVLLDVAVLRNHFVVHLVLGMGLLQGFWHVAAWLLAFQCSET